MCLLADRKNLTNKDEIEAMCNKEWFSCGKGMFRHFEDLADWAYTANCGGNPQLKSLLKRFGDLIMEISEDFKSLGQAVSDFEE